jgi:head-tail adaptor
MKSGKLRLRASFLAPNAARDALGNPQPRTTFATVWASLIPAGGSYKEKQEQVTTEGVWTLSIRYLTGIDTSFHVLYNNRLFEIVAIQDPDGRKRYQLCKLIERNSGRQ